MRSRRRGEEGDPSGRRVSEGGSGCEGGGEAAGSAQLGAPTPLHRLAARARPSPAAWERGREAVPQFLPPRGGAGLWALWGRAPCRRPGQGVCEGEPRRAQRGRCRGLAAGLCGRGVPCALQEPGPGAGPPRGRCVRILGTLGAALGFKAALPEHGYLLSVLCGTEVLISNKPFQLG